MSIHTASNRTIDHISGQAKDHPEHIDPYGAKQYLRLQNRRAEYFEVTFGVHRYGEKQDLRLPARPSSPASGMLKDRFPPNKFTLSNSPPPYVPRGWEPRANADGVDVSVEELPDDVCWARTERTAKQTRRRAIEARRV